MALRITVTLFGFFFIVLGTVHIAVSSTTAAMERIDVPGWCAYSGWTALYQSCYLFVREELDFYQASESCKTLAADLVSISSDEENHFIRAFVGDLPVWIGLYRTTNATCAGAGCVNWMWLDGSKLEYAHWSDGLPTTGQCVHMTRGDWWHGVLCSTKYGYVCEQKRFIPTTKSETTPKIRASEMTSSSNPANNDASSMDSSNNNDDGVNIPLIIGCVIAGLVGMQMVSTCHLS